MKRTDTNKIGYWEGRKDGQEGLILVRMNPSKDGCHDVGYMATSEDELDWKIERFKKSNI